jgi:hypothetical protein
VKISHLSPSGEHTEYEADIVTIHQGMDGVMVDMDDVSLIIGRCDKVTISDSDKQK